MKASEISSVLNTLCALILITLLLTHNNYLLDNHIWLYRVCTVYKGVVQSRYLYLLSAPNIHICNHIYCKPKVSEDYFFFFLTMPQEMHVNTEGGNPEVELPALSSWFVNSGSGRSSTLITSLKFITGLS